MELIQKIVGVAIAIFIAATLLPTALVALANDTAYTGVDATVLTVVQVLLPILAVVSIAIYLLPRRG